MTGKDVSIRFTDHMEIRLTAQNYRYWVIWRCPSVRFLDFAKVKDAERERATELFGSADEPSELAKTVAIIVQAVYLTRLNFPRSFLRDPAGKCQELSPHHGSSERS